MSNRNPKFNIEIEQHLETTTATQAIKFDDKLKEEILSQIHEEGMVIVHCTCHSENISIAAE